MVKKTQNEQESGEQQKETTKRPLCDKVINMCEHVDRTYYAKGYCISCYHSKGRKTLASACEHKERIAYAFGKCKNCYLSKYHKIRRDKLSETKKNDAGETYGISQLELIEYCRQNDLFLRKP